MNDSTKTSIKTVSINKDFAKTNAVLLSETPQTALVFLPEIHSGGVRGHIIRFKKSKNTPWEKIQEEDFRKLKLYEGVNIELDTQALTKLRDEAEKREAIASKEGIQTGRTEYVVTDKSLTPQINNQNIRKILEDIVKQNYSNAFWEQLKNSNPNLADKLTAGHMQLQRKSIIEELKARLTRQFHETIGDESWQKWIYKHNWLFGANYKEPIQKQKINISGVMPDYIFPTVDGFIDLLEIKLPTAEVIEEDKNHKGSWIWAKESNQAIGQVVNYLSEIDRQRLEIEHLIEQTYNKEITLLKPRAYILIGQNASWPKNKKEGLRKLNHALHGIEIITYTDLIKRGETFTNDTANL